MRCCLAPKYSTGSTAWENQNIMDLGALLGELIDERTFQSFGEEMDSYIGTYGTELFIVSHWLTSKSRRFKRLTAPFALLLLAL
ncbi:hypothetical protein EYC84_002735 [Monilinia fructicola]|uniref:Uncharacterized protein n=1 Tax=Monilinia fructicola TaxID=38448 RepID=A0A5M9JRN5_MONFR|nr:hypothetical protein EYC84_002735 [Monilinia fructicola]